MKGSIVQKKYGKKVKYYIVVDLPRQKGEKRKQKWFGSWDKKRDAEAALPEYLLQVQSTNYRTSSNVTFSDLAKDYLYRNQNVLAKATHRRYSFCVKEMDKHIGHYKLNEIEPYTIEQYFKKLIESGLKPSTVAKHKTVLQQIFKYALELRMIQHSPVPKLKVKGQAEINHETWSASEIRQFLAHIYGESLFTPVLIAATTGMRLGEVIALKWKDIDIDKGLLTVRKSKDIDNTLKNPKNKASRRLIHLMPEVLDMLKKHKNQQKKNRMQYGSEYKVSDFICTLDNGKPLTANYVSVMFKRKIEQYNFTHIRFHDLRHSFATISLSNGVHAKVVQEILGHSTIRTTLDTYSHVLPTVHQDSMDIITQAFGS